jgi:hypothetical protein
MCTFDGGDIQALDGTLDALPERRALGVVAFLGAPSIRDRARGAITIPSNALLDQRAIPAPFVGRGKITWEHDIGPSVDRDHEIPIVALSGGRKKSRHLGRQQSRRPLRNGAQHVGRKESSFSLSRHVVLPYR